MPATSFAPTTTHHSRDIVREPFHFSFPTAASASASATTIVPIHLSFSRGSCPVLSFEICIVDPPYPGQPSNTYLPPTTTLLPSSPPPAAISTLLCSALITHDTRQLPFQQAACHPNLHVLTLLSSDLAESGDTSRPGPLPTPDLCQPCDRVPRP